MVRDSVAKRRPGPKPKGPIADKRRAFTTRITEETRKRLEQASVDSGRSISQEAELRLERTFADDERIGGIAAYRLMQIFGLAKQLIEDRTGKPFESDPSTYDEVTEAWTAILEKFRPKGVQKRSYGSKGLLSRSLGRELGEDVAEHFANIGHAKPSAGQPTKPKRKAEKKR